MATIIPVIGLTSGAYAAACAIRAGLTPVEGGLRPGLMATPKSRAESLIAFGRITTSVPLTRDSLEPPATR